MKWLIPLFSLVLLMSSAQATASKCNVLIDSGNSYVNSEVIRIFKDHQYTIVGYVETNQDYIALDIGTYRKYLLPDESLPYGRKRLQVSLEKYSVSDGPSHIQLVYDGVKRHDVQKQVIKVLMKNLKPCPF